MNKRNPRYIPYVKELSILREGVNHSKSLLKHHRASVSSPCTHDDIIIMCSAFYFVYNIMWNKTADDGRGKRDRETERERERESELWESWLAWGEGDEHFRFAITHQKSANDPFGAAVFFTPFFYSFIFALSTLVVRFHREWNSFWFMMSKNALHTQWTPPPPLPLSHTVD